ncbi:MAG TPA: S66 peptidase family protein [Pantanalinema sp.]
MALIKPLCLEEGDAIGIVSPSSPVAAFCPRRFERGVQALTSLGFKVVVADNARERYGHTAGTVEQRVNDLHAMFRDPAIKAVIATIGGFNSNQLLDRLDYDLIRTHPKILVGYSDITALLVGIHRMTGLITFLGPAIMPQFGESGGLHPYTERWFRAVLLGAPGRAEVAPSLLSIHERLAWDTEDDRPRRAKRHAGPRVLKSGIAEGPIVAGNLGTMLALAGSPYFPDLEGAILCVEEDETESPATVDRFFTQLRLMGAFERIAALVVGRFHPQVGFTAADSLETLVLSVTQGFDLPVAIDFDFGHTDPMITLPQGIRARVDFTTGSRLELLEQGVEKSPLTIAP